MKDFLVRCSPFIGEKGWRKRLDNILSKRVFGSALLGATVGFEFTVIVGLITGSLLLKAVIGLLATLAVVLLMMYWDVVEEKAQELTEE
jgi:uncharacterized membrane protein